MNTLTIKGDWNITKGKLRQKYAQLTDNDLQYVKGQEDELMGRIQKRTGAAADQILSALEEINRDSNTGDSNRAGHAHAHK